MEEENGTVFFSEKELTAENDDQEKHDLPTDQTAEAETARLAVENAGKLTGKPSNAATKSLRTSKPVSKLSTTAKTSAAMRGSTVRSVPITPGSRSSPSTASRTRRVDNNGNLSADNIVRTSLTSVSSSKAAASANSHNRRNSIGTPFGIAERRASISSPATPRQRLSSTPSTPAKPSPSVAETRRASLSSVSTRPVASSSSAEPKKSSAPSASKLSSSSLKSPSVAGSPKLLSPSTRSSPRPTENAVRRTAAAKPSVPSPRGSLQSPSSSVAGRNKTASTLAETRTRITKSLDGGSSILRNQASSLARGARHAPTSLSTDRISTLSNRRKSLTPDSKDSRFIALPQVEVKAGDDVVCSISSLKTAFPLPVVFFTSPNIELNALALPLDFVLPFSRNRS